MRLEYWCRRQESNSRPPDYKSGALPTELHRRKNVDYAYIGCIWQVGAIKIWWQRGFMATEMGLWRNNYGWLTKLGKAGGKDSMEREVDTV